MAELGMFDWRNPSSGLYERRMLESLDGISAQQYNQLFKGQIKGAYDHTRFDTLSIIAGTAIGLTDKSIFAVPVTQTGATADGGTTFKKDKADTNMKVANEMESGNVMIVESFQVEAFVPSAIATADTRNRITDPTAVAGATLSPTLNLLPVLRDAWIDFKIGDRTVLEGRPIDFPQAGGISGFGGGVEDGGAQNGPGFAKPLREIIVLGPSVQFYVTYTPFINATPTLDINLVFKMAGVRLRPVG